MIFYYDFHIFFHSLQKSLLLSSYYSYLKDHFKFREKTLYSFQYKEINYFLLDLKHFYLIHILSEKKKIKQNHRLMNQKIWEKKKITESCGHDVRLIGHFSRTMQIWD